MAARGKAVRSAVSSGRHEITKGMRKTRSIGQDIAGWNAVHEVQIPGTKIELSRPLLDTLTLDAPFCAINDEINRNTEGEGLFKILWVSFG